MSGTRARLTLLFISIVLLTCAVFQTSLAQTTQNMAVTATVPANANNFAVNLVQNTSGTRFPQDTELSYTITYGSTLEANVDLTLVASWSRGTLDGESTPTLDIIDYVPGSASNAYNSTPPVIDTINRTITWAITSFPGATTNQQVTFKLTTNHSYTGTTFANFTVSAQANGATASSAVSSVTKEYQYDPSLEPTATPTPTSVPSVTPTPTPAGIGPSATPGPRPTSSPTPSPTSAPRPSDLPFRFVEIGLETISPDAASIRARTTQNATAILTYGTATTALTETVSDLTLLRDRLIRLSGLKENTRYYFRITARNASGGEITSDLYTFKTGGRGQAPVVDRGRTIITSEHILLHPSADGTFVIPTNMNYELNLVFTNPSVIKKTVLSVGNPNVLGLSTVTPPPVANYSGGEMKETEPGKYAARLSSPLKTDTYAMTVRVSDTSGNIINIPIGKLKVIGHLTVLEKNTGKPIEHARIKLSHRNYRTGKYEPISPQILPIPNPVYTDPSGITRVVLPQGRYRADITTILNKPSRTDFTIGPGVHDGFPTVYMDPEPFSPISFIRYQWETCLEALAILRTTMETMTKSLRLFELNAYFLLLLFVVFTYIALAKRMRIPLRSLRSHLGYRLKASYYSSVSEKRIEGKVTDSASNETLSGAHVYLIDPRFNTVLSHALSKPNGTFVFPVYDTHRYVLEVMKDGYAPNRFHEDSLELVDGVYNLNVERHTSPQHRVAIIGDNVLSLGLEVLLILSFILEILFVYVFGWAKTAPFIILSLFNLFLVVLHRLGRDK